MADSIYVLGEGGVVFKMDLPLPEAIADRLTKGYLRQVNPDGSPIEESERPTQVRPAVNAPKADWVGWAVHEGMTPDDAEAATKADLIEKFGATPLVEAAPAPAVPEEAPADPAAEPTPEVPATDPAAPAPAV